MDAVTPEVDGEAVLPEVEVVLLEAVEPESVLGVVLTADELEDVSLAVPEPDGVLVVAVSVPFVPVAAVPLDAVPVSVVVEEALFPEVS